MTCIVAVKKNKNVWIGGDSAGIAGYTIRTRKDEKVFKNSNMIFGFTTSFRMGQLLRYSFKPPAQKIGTTVMEYLCTSFIDALLECYKSNNYGAEKDSIKTGGTFIIGYKGQIYTVESDFQISEVADDFTAVGSGYEYALGALKVTNNKNPKECINAALQAAEYFDSNVRCPFNIVSLK